jgi:CBS domain-containing protein
MRAQDVMNRTVATVHPETSLLDAANRLLDAHISGLPVVDDAGKLVGIFTEGDLLRRHETATEAHHAGWLDLLLGPGHLATDYVRANARTVRDLMAENPITVTEDTPLADVVKLMERRHIKRVPVMRGDALVGLVSRADIVRAVARQLAEAPRPAPCSDDAIRAALDLELGNAKWANAHNITVRVEGGEVTLEGVIFNEAVRPALRVAAENTAGVTKVTDQMVWVEPVTGAALGA